MKNKILLPALLAILFLPTALQVQAGISTTQSYRVSVTIPAVVGINVFPEGEDSFLKEALKQTSQSITKENVIRDNQQIVLETIVLK